MTDASAPPSAPLIPHLVCRDASGAIEFYARAFGAESLMALDGPDGRLLHGCLRVNGGILFLCDECPEAGATAPPALGGSPVTLHLQVADCDAAFARAVDAGCTAEMPPQDMFWGDRYGVLVDPYGHRWSLAHAIRALSEDELRAAAAEACAPG